MGTHELIYHSLTELIDKVHLKPHRKNRENRQAIRFRVDDNNKDRTWYGEAWKPSKVVDAVKTGYPPGLDRISEAINKINIDEIPSIRRKRSFGDSGDSLDIHKVYSGQLDKAWQKCRKAEGSKSKKNITIAINIGAHCMTLASEMVWCGAYGAALADAYALAGYSVEVWGYGSCKNMSQDGKDEFAGFSIKLLDTQEPFDIEKLASTVCFPGFYRTLVFEAFISLPFKVSWDLGRPVDCPPTHLKDAIIINKVRSLEDIEKAERRKKQRPYHLLYSQEKNSKLSY